MKSFKIEDKNFYQAILPVLEQCFEVVNHYCKKYNKRLFYYTDSIYHSPEIYACEECNNQTYNTYNKLDKYIREEFRRSMEDDSAFKINYPSAEKIS